MRNDPKVAAARRVFPETDSNAIRMACALLGRGGRTKHDGPPIGGVTVVEHQLG